MRSEITKEGFSIVIITGDVSIATAVSKQEEANKNQVGGFNDWVLPDSLILLALFQSANELRNGRIYWSSSSPPKVNAFAGIYVSSASGFIGGFDENGRAGVLLVRHNQIQEIGRKGYLAAMKNSETQLKEIICI